MEQTLIRSPHNLLVLRGLNGVEHPLSDVTLVGREAECQLQLLEGHASRYHAKLTVTGSHQILVEDLKSTNGTYVNGQRVETPIVASLGDELRFDTSRFRIATQQSGDAQATVFRSRETLTPPPEKLPPSAVQPVIQPVVPKPAPQLITPAPQVDDIAALTPRPETQAPSAAAAQSTANQEPAPVVSTPADYLSEQADNLAEKTAIAAPPSRAAESRVTGSRAAVGGAEDGRVTTGKTKAKKLAQFQTQDQPSTGTSSLPADELANLAAKSSRTVRRLESNTGPRLVVLNPPARGMIFPLADTGSVSEWLIGRGDDADVALTDRTVSVRHAAIRKTGSRWEVENLNATNGVFVNGKLVSRRPINSGDKIRLGRTEMQFRTDNDPTSEIGQVAVTPPTTNGLPPTAMLALAGAVFIALFVLILILVLQRGP